MSIQQVTSLTPAAWLLLLPLPLRLLLREPRSMPVRDEDSLEARVTLSRERLIATARDDCFCNLRLQTRVSPLRLPTVPRRPACVSARVRLLCLRATSCSLTRSPASAGNEKMSRCRRRFRGRS